MSFTVVQPWAFLLVKSAGPHVSSFPTLQPDSMGEGGHLTLPLPGSWDGEIGIELNKTQPQGSVFPFSSFIV